MLLSSPKHKHVRACAGHWDGADGTLSTGMPVAAAGRAVVVVEPSSAASLTCLLVLSLVCIAQVDVRMCKRSTSSSNVTLIELCVCCSSRAIVYDCVQ